MIPFYWVVWVSFWGKPVCATVIKKNGVLVKNFIFGILFEVLFVICDSI